MKILMIATGFPPYLFSENLCNGKLALAMIENGIDLTVISMKDEGPLYGDSWIPVFYPLKNILYQIDYKVGNKVKRACDVIYSGIIMNGNFIEGVRWARRAYKLALRLHKEKKFDVIITRSPNDISHLVGYKLTKKYGIRWIANWNDPADPIWPEPYKHIYSDKKQKKKLAFTETLLNCADINTFPSDSLLQHFEDNFAELRNKNTYVISHIGLNDTYLPQTSKIKKDGKLKFLHSGNLSKERSPENLFLGLSRLKSLGFKDFEFHIMGNINQYVGDLISRYDLDREVKFLGAFNYLDSLRVMKEYDVLVVIEAILEKGIFFPSKITDYIQAKRPILSISPAQGFAHDLLGSHQDHFFADNKDTNEIFNVLMTIKNKWINNDLLCNNEDLAENMSPDKVVNDLMSIINNLDKNY